MTPFAKHEPATDPFAEMTALEAVAVERGLEGGLTGIDPDSFSRWAFEKVSSLSHVCHRAPSTSVVVIDGELTRHEGTLAGIELTARKTGAPTAGTPSPLVMAGWLGAIGVSTLLAGLLLEHSRGSLDVKGWMLIGCAGALVALLALLAMLTQRHVGRALAAWSTWRATAPLRRQVRRLQAERARVVRAESARVAWVERSHRLLETAYLAQYQRGLRARELEESASLEKLPAGLPGALARNHSNNSAERGATPNFNRRG